MSDNSKKSGLVSISSFACFIALGVSAVLAFITYLLPLAVESFSLGENVVSILQLISQISSLIGLGFGALGFAATHGKLAKFLTFLFVLVFIVAIVLFALNII